MTKLATLRDVCLSNGIILACRNYKLEEEEEKELSNTSRNFVLPFKTDDIIDLIPIVKHLDPTCENVRSQIELASRKISEGEKEEPAEILLSAVQIILNVSY